MSADAPRPLTYTTPSGPEFMLRYGPSNGPQLLVLQPLFEEMNRCRSLITALCRTLSGQGIGCWLPDLPGTGESLRALETVGWDDWVAAFGAACATIGAETGEQPHVAAIRGGALLQTNGWRLSPVAGASLLTDLRRSGLTNGGDVEAPAGYRLSPGLTNGLGSAEPPAGPGSRTLRLASDGQPADRHVDAPPLWRRPEPQRDDAFAETLAQDILAWIRT